MYTGRTLFSETLQVLYEQVSGVRILSGSLETGHSHCPHETGKGAPTTYIWQVSGFIRQAITPSRHDRRMEPAIRLATTAFVTKLFVPDIVAAREIMGNIRLDEVYTQLFIGHGGFSEYLARFMCKEKPSCICDKDEPETVQRMVRWFKGHYLHWNQN